jgi:F-type H+-transporting ATPase subunit b
MKLLAASGGGLGPLMPNPVELTIGTIAFLIVFGLLGKVLWPRISKTLQERTESIEGGLKHAEEAQAEAQRVLDQYRAQLAEARHDASRLREEAKEEGARIKAELRAEGEAERRRIIEAAHAQIEADRRQTLTALRAEVGRLAVELASRVVGEVLAEDARARQTVERFLDEFERQSAGEAEATASR